MVQADFMPMTTGQFAVDSSTKLASCTETVEDVFSPLLSDPKKNGPISMPGSVFHCSADTS